MFSYLALKGGRQFQYHLSIFNFRELAKKFVVELLAMGTKVVVLDTVIDTDMKTKLNVAVHLVNSLVGIQLKRYKYSGIIAIGRCSSLVNSSRRS